MCYNAILFYFLEGFDLLHIQFGVFCVTSVSYERKMYTTLFTGPDFESEDMFCCEWDDCEEDFDDIQGPIT